MNTEGNAGYKSVAKILAWAIGMLLVIKIIKPLVPKILTKYAASSREQMIKIPANSKNKFQRGDKLRLIMMAFKQWGLGGWKLNIELLRSIIVITIAETTYSNDLYRRIMVTEVGCMGKLHELDRIYAESHNLKPLTWWERWLMADIITGLKTAPPLFDITVLPGYDDLDEERYWDDENPKGHCPCSHTSVDHYMFEGQCTANGCKCPKFGTPLSNWYEYTQTDLGDAPGGFKVYE